MKRRSLFVGAIATFSVALAAGALGASTPATSGGGGVGLGGAGAAARALGGVLWLVALGALLAGGAWAGLERLRGTRELEFSTSRVVAAVALVLALALP